MPKASASADGQMSACNPKPSAGRANPMGVRTMMMGTEVLHGGEMAGDSHAVATAAPTTTSRVKGCRTWLAILLMTVSVVQVAHSVIVTDAWIDAMNVKSDRLISMRFPPILTTPTPEVAGAEEVITAANR